MKILNLTYLEKSDIKYKIDRFPDGQQQVVLDLKTCAWEIQGEKLLDVVPYVQIKSRLNNFQDLELIICATKSLRTAGAKSIHLYVPYFLGSRSDRQFEEGSNNYLKDVICPIINSLGFESVTCMDPHSYVLEACLNNFKKSDNSNLVLFSLKDLIKGTKQQYEDNFILISPDAGASHKIYKLAEQIGYKGDIITCSKERDKNGKLTKTIIPDSISYSTFDKDMIIIDDICDGGATFINIAEAIREKQKDCNLYLIVTHGIFSKGFSELNKYFDGIYCTNSYKDIIVEGYQHKEEKGFYTVKQLNIF